MRSRRYSLSHTSERLDPKALSQPRQLRGIRSNPAASEWYSLHIAAKAAVCQLGFSLLLLITVLMGIVSPALAAEKFCSEAPFNGVVDGDVLVTPPIQITIDTDCTFKNWPQSNQLTTTINFQTNDPTIYLIIFDNVYFTGHMACASVDHRIWFANSSDYGSSNACQDLFIPVETIDKKNPAGQTTAAIGVPFTYTLTLPSMQLSGDPSNNDLHSTILTDDLNATGADLSYVSHVAYWQDSPTTSVPHTFSNVGGLLTFDFDSQDVIIPAGKQVVVKITVVLDDTLTNTPGTQFTNTAKWSFGRLIDGVYYEPLPGEWGISEPMTIAGPDLVVTKTSSQTALNLGVPATFTIDVQNTGGGEAWNVTVLDEIPEGMCDYDPTTGPGVSAQIFAADGVTPVSSPLVKDTDYSVTFTRTPTTCQLSLTTLDTLDAKIGPSERLIITYESQLDPGITTDGLPLTNVAGAIQWFSGDSSLTGRRRYDRGPLTDGTPGILDFQDSETVTTALSGYYFEKTVENLISGENPATTAAPGDMLRYRLRLFNVDQAIDGIAVSDTLDQNRFDLSSFAMVTLPGSATYTFDFGTGQLEISGDLSTPLSVSPGGELVIEFEITLLPTLTSGTVVSNQASLTADQGTPADTSDDFSTESDDPYTNGVSSPYDPDDQDPTDVTILSPDPLLKATTQTSATIGEQFTYRITVPAAPVNMPLYDVRILDDLAPSAADMRFVSASVVSGGSWSLSNTGSATDIIIEDTAAGIDIFPNSQAVIEITVELQNTLANQDGLTFMNSASYTYNRMNGNNLTQTVGSAGGTVDMNVIEPDLTATKTVRFVTPAGKLPTDPATVGDVLEYAVTIPNGGNSAAFDTSVVDILPTNVSLVPDSATAQINGVGVAGFAVTPTTLAGGALAWGQQNGDLALDIPVGQTLVLTYQVTVEAVTGADINNSVYVDWTSLNDGYSAERTGAGCPNIVTPNDYCYGPATVSVATLDNTSIAKAAVADSYAETPPSTTDPVVRVGDTVTYDLILNLQEYTTRNVVVEDDLPTGMALESFAITAGANFSYMLTAQPSSGDTGTLRWVFGDITNLPSNDGTPIDTLVIQYVAKVVIDPPPTGVTYDTHILLDNTARLYYTGGDPVVYPGRLTATETVDVRQPQMRPISKIDLGTGRVGTGTAANPYQVNISTDVMNFQLSSCNDGLAPAYGVVITDQLAPELDETDLVANPPVVTIGATTLISGTDYTYTAPARGGVMRISLLDSAPVNPTECVTVGYDIGFHTDLTVSTSWSNRAELPEYWSLPLSQSGRLYSSTSLAEVWMTNLVNDEQLLKTLLSPTEATIGDLVIYRITVPAVPVNTALDDVVVIDALHGALEYVGATAVDGGGAPVALTDNSVAPGDVNLGILNIPAGEQVIITLTARVLNNDQANAGVSVTNTASYTYTNIPAGLDTSSTSGAVTLVEPLLAIAKTVTNVSSPGAAPNVGDILRYRVTFTASGGAAGDNFSDAFDLLIEDDLSLGLAYQNGTASVNGTGNSIIDPTLTGNGSTTPQTLTWSPTDSTADIDVVEGSRVTLTYDVVVLNGVLAGQELTNSATVQWTGQDGDNSFERNGTGTPVENDYFTGPASVTVMTDLAGSFVKSVVNVTTGEDPGAHAEPGDTLRYTIVLTNESIVPVNNVSVVDELDEHFAPGSLQLLSVSDPGAVTANTDAWGGANGTGIVDIRNLSLAVQGDPGDSITIVFEARLAHVIQNGTIVLNRAQLTGDNLTPKSSNQTSTLIRSAPAFDVWKTSQDITGDPAELMAGDSLLYTITIKNIGNEDAVNTVLQDQIPANTTYVAGTTRLNGVLVADPAPGASALQDGMLVNAPENTTAGYMRADASATTGNVATVTFEVVIDSGVVDGTIIANQGFVTAAGTGSGPVSEEPSDDPETPLLDDPTLDVVGNVPLVDAQKTVDNLSGGVVYPGDVLRYTITITNGGAAPATGVVFTDAVPADTTYVPNSVYLNGIPVGQPDGGISPLVSGIDVSSSDLTPPLPGSGNGTLSLGSTAVVTFDVRVNSGVAAGTPISNQGYVSTNEQLDEPTDADGIDSNGDQPTVVVVGDSQLLSILKEVFVVGGGPAVPGSELEYVIRVTNISSLPATRVVVTDDLGFMAGQVTYIAGSGSMNGSPVGVTYSGSVLSAAYSAQYGDLPPGGRAVVRFRVRIAPAVAIGTTLTNTGMVRWDDPAQTASARVSLIVGGTPGSATLNGSVWHDANLDKSCDSGTETMMNGWSVELYRNNQLLATVLTDANGVYRLTGLAPNVGTPEFYELRFLAAGAGPGTASMGQADSPFIDGPQRISNIAVSSGDNLQGLNLPLWPNGAVYDSVERITVAGATVTMLNATTGAPLPGQCFDDPVQQNQVTAADGFYKFDLNFTNAACPAGAAYLIEVTPPPTGYMSMPSQIIAPADDAGTAPFSVPACPGSADDAVPATTEYCEVLASTSAPPPSVQPGTAGTTYHLHLALSDGNMPGQSQIFNNLIPVDPVLNGAVAITKTSSLTDVSRGSLVPYTITVTNVYGAPLYDISILDRFPAGFKYKAGSSRLNGDPTEPLINGRELVWENLDLQVNEKLTFRFLLVVGSGVSEGEYTNRAIVLNAITGGAVSGEATATVRVVPDPDFDCTDVIGKVFDDRNLNGSQDSGEKGLYGVRVVTARGLIASTDTYGRFHITCATVPDEDRGSNFILKLDERSLPSGYRLTTENPRIERATRGKMLRFNFGATIHRVVRLDIADGVFEPNTSDIRIQWRPRIEQLLEELEKAPSVLRLSYLGDIEPQGLVQERLEALKKKLTDQWEQSDAGYRLTIEIEIFWRRGAPLPGQS